MNKKILFIPFLLGLILFIYSWYDSYPVAVTGTNDYIFDHMSVLYWASIPLLLSSMFLIALTVKNRFIKWAFSIGLVLTIYSIAYFYIMLPSADSQYFRGLTESFISTNNLDSTVPSHDYYQWPIFFVLGKISAIISGLQLPVFEIILYSIIGLLMASSLYLFGYKKFGDAGFVTVAAFFVSIFYFFNFQAVPFTLGFSLLLLIFVLETLPKTTPVKITMAILYAALLLSHAFVPLFLVLYFFFRFLLGRNKQYGLLFVLSLIGYLLVQFTIANVSFAQNIIGVLTRPAEYSSMVETVLLPVEAHLDVVAQLFSRIVTVSSVGICALGFIVMVIKRKLTIFDKSILLTGLFYSGVGLVVYTLGTRTLPLAFIPVSLGAVYLFGSKYKKYFVAAFLIILLLFVFVPLHQSYYYEVQAQTKEAYFADNYFIAHYDWQNSSLILANYRVINYIMSRAGVYEGLFTTKVVEIPHIDSVIYTIGLEKDLYGQNYSSPQLFNDTALNVLYSNGASFIGVEMGR